VHVKGDDAREFLVMVDLKTRMEMAKPQIDKSKDIQQVWANARLYEAMTGLRVEYGALVVATRRPDRTVYLVVWKLDAEDQDDLVRRSVYRAMLDPLRSGRPVVYADRGAAAAFSAGPDLGAVDLKRNAGMNAPSPDILLLHELWNLEVFRASPALERPGEGNFDLWRERDPEQDSLLQGIEEDAWDRVNVKGNARNILLFERRVQRVGWTPEPEGPKEQERWQGEAEEEDEGEGGGPPFVEEEEEEEEAPPAPAPEAPAQPPPPAPPGRFRRAAAAGAIAAAGAVAAGLGMLAANAGGAGAGGAAALNQTALGARPFASAGPQGFDRRADPVDNEPDAPERALLNSSIQAAAEAVYDGVLERRGAERALRLGMRADRLFAYLARFSFGSGGAVEPPEWAREAQGDGRFAPLRVGAVLVDRMAGVQPPEPAARVEEARAVAVGVLCRTLNRLVNERVQRVFFAGQGPPDAALHPLNRMVTRRETARNFLHVSQRGFWPRATLRWALGKVDEEAAALWAKVEAWDGV